MAQTGFSGYLDDLADQNQWWTKGWARLATLLVGIAVTVWLLAGLVSSQDAPAEVAAFDSDFGVTASVPSGFGTSDPTLNTGGLSTPDQVISEPATNSRTTTPPTDCDIAASMERAVAVVIAQVTGDWSTVTFAAGSSAPATPNTVVPGDEVSITSVESTGTCGEFAVGIEFPYQGSTVALVVTESVSLVDGTWAYTNQGN